MPDDLISSLLAALESRPDDVPLRLHVAGLLLDAGRAAEALPHLSQVLTVRTSDEQALALLARASAALGAGPPAPPPAPSEQSQFDWAAAEADIGPVAYAEPAYVEGASGHDPNPAAGHDIEAPTLRLADVGGMEDVRRRLDVAFLTPMRNPALREAFGKSLRGGLLLYAPWDVDPALRRPGRLDRMVLVVPPDAPARDAILRHHLGGRPCAGIDVARLVSSTAEFSGADLAHLVETAAEQALSDSVASGTIRPITMKDFAAARREVRATTMTWFTSARNVAEFANDHGEYDDLVAYLRRRRIM